MTFARVILILDAIFFIPFGIAGLVDPARVGGFVGVQFPTPDAMADGRAVYGGVTLALGLFFGWCALRPEHVRIGLVAAVIAVALPFLGRLTGILVDGAAATETYQTLATEGVITALSAVALLRAR